MQTLDSRHYQWHIAGLNAYGDMETVLKNLGAEIMHVSSGQAHGPERAARALRNYITERQINIVHTHTPRAIFESSIAMAGMAARPHHIATKHLLTSYKDRRWGIFYSLFDTLTLYLPDRLATVSESMREVVLALPGRWDDKVVTVQNAIPCEEFYLPDSRTASRLNLGIDSDQLVFGYAGRIEPVKSLDLLLRVFAEIHTTHPKTHLVLIGEGSQRDELEQYAKKLGIDNAITWTGFRADIPDLLSAIDVYVQPSQNEGLSLSILEAMAAGKPVIATNVGGARELLCHDETGLVIPSNSCTALSKAMLELSMRPELRMRLGEAARKHVCQSFGLQRMVNEYGRIYQSLAVNGGGY